MGAVSAYVKVRLFFVIRKNPAGGRGGIYHTGDTEERRTRGNVIRVDTRPPPSAGLFQKKPPVAGGLQTS